jgi:FdhE protein
MSGLGAPHGLTDIGEESKPPYAVLPDPSSVFLRRSQRLAGLAPGHTLEPYLAFASEVTAAQHKVQAKLPEVELPAADRIRQALDYGIPPLLRSGIEPGAAMDAALHGLLEAMRVRDMPQEAHSAIGSLDAASQDRRLEALRAALQDVPTEGAAERVLILAALQVYFAKLAAKLAVEDLRPIADGVCPVCGSPPMTSSVVGWPRAHNTRFCACPFCSTMWHAVRIKCVLCGSTGGIAYRAIEGKPETVKAETCDACGRYVKILYQVNDPMLDPLADDIASLDLDILLTEAGWQRGGVNPFLLGY